MTARTDWRERNLLLSSAIVLGGFFAALLFHSLQEARGYPWNTLMFAPWLRFSDFTDVVASAARPDPYAIWSLYFPFTYVFFRPWHLLSSRVGVALLAVCLSVVVLRAYRALAPRTPLGQIATAAMLIGASWAAINFVLWPMPVGFALVVVGCLYYLLTRFHRVLRPLTTQPWLAAGATAIVTLLAYPMLACLDRGNIEIILLALVVAFLTDFAAGREWRGVAWLSAAMCFKFYPAALLAIFLPKRRAAPIALAGLTFGLITAVSLALFSGSIPNEIAHWRQQLTLFRDLYIVGNRSMGGSAGPWNAVKFVYLKLATSPTAAATTQLLNVYSLLTALVAAYVAWHVARVEHDPARQQVLLILFMVSASPGGADYKLIYVIAALVIAIGIEPVRVAERTLVPLLALVLVPKRYGFLPDVITDSGHADAAIGVLINPILIAAAGVILIVGGWRASRR